MTRSRTVLLALLASSLLVSAPAVSQDNRGLYTDAGAVDARASNVRRTNIKTQPSRAAASQPPRSQISNGRDGLSAPTSAPAPSAVSGRENLNGRTFPLTSYNVSSDHCLGCGPVLLESQSDFADYLEFASAELVQRTSDRARAFVPGQDSASNLLANKGTQLVYLNFNTIGIDTFPVCFIDNAGEPTGVAGIFDDHVFTQSERDQIQSAIEADFSDFNFLFTQEEPMFGEFTVITFADNDSPEDCSTGSNISLTAGGGISVLFGRADEIDFGNRNKSSSAFTDVSIWEFLSEFNGGVNFEGFSRLDVDNDFGGDITAAVSFAVVNQAANTGAHELGHTLGLRHQNSFGAPGDGLPNTGRISPFDFVPVFTGPSNAAETILHTMASGASVGLPFDGGVNLNRFFSERSAIRLAVNERAMDLVQFESQMSSSSENGRNQARGNQVSLQQVLVPNTINNGQNEDAFLNVKASIVGGRMLAIGETDSYYVDAKAGDFLNAELVPVIATGQTFTDGILGQLRIFRLNDDGTETLAGSNIRSFESLFDTEIFDIVVPTDGTYRIEVTAPDEVYIQDFDGDGVIDVTSLTDAGAPELQTGGYGLFVFTCEKRLDGSTGPQPPVPGPLDNGR